MSFTRLGLVIVIAATAIGAGLWLWAPWQPRVQTARVIRGPAVDAVYATGVVEPLTLVEVAPTLTGRIDKISIDEGDTVKPGQELIRLDDREAKAQCQERQAKLRFLEDELVRQRNLLKTQTASRQAYERAVSDEAQAKAALAAACQRAKDLLLTAPVEGVVLRRDAEEGAVAAAGKALIWIGPPRPLRVSADVDEEDMPAVKTGQKALIKADAFRDKAIEGQISQVTPKGDPVNQTFRVRIALPENSGLLIGMTVEVNIVTRETRDARLVPAKAVRDGAVWVIDNGVARRRTVKVGTIGDKLAEIRDSLDEDAMVVVDPPARLADGMTVRVISTPDK